jgi:hypothetical protein
MWRLPGKRQIRQIALALLLPALMFRAVIPAGYMPTVGTMGHVSLVMCSAVDVVAGGTSGGIKDRHSPENSRGSGPCHFAASTALAPLPDSGWSAWLAVANNVADRPNAIEVHSPNIVRAQSPRGPPAPRYA